jgi:hypothetical protein
MPPSKNNAPMRASKQLAMACRSSKSWHKSEPWAYSMYSSRLRIWRQKNPKIFHQKSISLPSPLCPDQLWSLPTLLHNRHYTEASHDTDDGAQGFLLSVHSSMFLRSLLRLKSQASTVGIAIGYRLDDLGVGVRIPVGARISSSPHTDQFWGPPSLLSNGY